MASSMSARGRKRPSRGTDAGNSSDGYNESGPEDSGPARKRAKVNTSGPPSGSDELDEGEIRDSSPNAQLLETDATAAAQPRELQGGWNRAVGSGLRTSFGAATKLNLRAPLPKVEWPSSEPEARSEAGSEPKSEPSPGPQSEPQPEPKSGPSPEHQSEPQPEPEVDEMVVESAVYEKPVLGLWSIPSDPAFDTYHKKLDPKNGDTWESRLSHWFSVVAPINQEKSGLLVPEVFLEVWRQWLSSRKNISPDLKANGLNSTTADGLGPAKIKKMIEKARKAMAKPLPKALPKPLAKAPPNPPPMNQPPMLPKGSFDFPNYKEELWVKIFMDWIRAVVPRNEEIKQFDNESTARLLEYYPKWVVMHGIGKPRVKVALRAAKVTCNSGARAEVSKAIAECVAVRTPTAPGVISLPSPSEGEVSAEASIASSRASVVANKDAKPPRVPAVTSKGAGVGAIGHAAVATQVHPAAVANGNASMAAQGNPAVATNPNATVTTNPNAGVSAGVGGAIGHALMAAQRNPSGNAAEVTHGYTALPELPVIPATREPYKILSREQELDCRANYWPFVKEDEVFCLVCINHGHNSADCPLLICRWCSQWGHRFFVCPTRHRCTKCRQLGHEASTCTEKLILPLDQMVCAACGDGDHLENTCNEMFRDTFNPPPERIRKVKHLPIWCACCGKEGHYFTECAMNTSLVTAVHRSEWSTAKTMAYVDPNSEHIAICYEGKVQPAINPGFQIRGAAAEGRPAHLKGRSIVPQRHVEYFEADDDDDEIESFVRPPVQRPPPVAGRITFSSFSSSNNTGSGNGGGGNRSGGGRGGRGGGGQGNGNRRANPPLPPGPPPPSFRSGRDNHHGGGGGGGGAGGSRRRNARDARAKARGGY